MAKLPKDLPWRDFVAVLKRLGYYLDDSGSGAMRTFSSDTRSPHTVTFHEPHGSAGIKPGTLSWYLRKLELDRDEFLALLKRKR